MAETKYKVTWSKNQDREPVIGDITTGDQIGFKNKVAHKVKLTYRACTKCNKPRWVQSYYPTTKLICRKCNAKRVGSLAHFGPTNSCWRGGKIYRRGYTLVRINRNHRFFKMCNSTGYIGEHRLVAAEKLNRPLEKWEQVHHLNGKKSDNRPENLVVLEAHKHFWVTKLTLRIQELEKKVEELENERKNITTTRNIN